VRARSFSSIMGSSLFGGEPNYNARAKTFHAIIVGGQNSGEPAATG